MNFGIHDGYFLSEIRAKGIKPELRQECMEYCAQRHFHSNFNYLGHRRSYFELQFRKKFKARYGTPEASGADRVPRPRPLDARHMHGYHMYSFVL